MSVSKTATGYRIDFQIEGKRLQKVVKCCSREEAKAIEAKWKQEFKNQLYLGTKPSKTWADAGKRWIEEKSNKRTIKNDAFSLIWLCEYIDNYYLNDITNEVIEKLAKIKEASGVKPATVNRLLALIKSILKKCCDEWEWLDKVPKIRMRPEDNERTRWLTHSEAQALIIELKNRGLIHLADITQFALVTGLRSGNVLSLKWEWVDLGNRIIKVPRINSKNKLPFTRLLNSEAVEIIRRQIGKHNEFVFTYKGNPIGQCNTKAWKKALKTAGITDFRFHDLRHTWASWHVQNGTSLHALYELGDWEDFSMVQRYAHLSNEQVKDAAENSRVKIACKDRLTIV